MARLAIAKLDRLSRNLAFIATLMESGVEFVAVDNPHATPLTIHILAAVAQHERTMISQRTKDALAAAKRRGVRLGNPRPAAAAKKGAAAVKANAKRFAANMLPVIREILASGVTTNAAIADKLNERRLTTGAVVAGRIVGLMRSWGEAKAETLGSPWIRPASALTQTAGNPRGFWNYNSVGSSG